MSSLLRLDMMSSLKICGRTKSAFIVNKICSEEESHSLPNVDFLDQNQLFSSLAVTPATLRSEPFR